MEETVFAFDEIHNNLWYLIFFFLLFALHKTESQVYSRFSFVSKPIFRVCSFSLKTISSGKLSNFNMKNELEYTFKRDNLDSDGCDRNCLDSHCLDTLTHGIIFDLIRREMKQRIFTGQRPLFVWSVIVVGPIGRTINLSTVLAHNFAIRRNSLIIFSTWK